MPCEVCHDEVSNRAPGIPCAGCGKLGRGRPKKSLQTTRVEVAASGGAAASPVESPMDVLFTAAGAPGRNNEDGSRNPDWFRWAFKQVNDLNVAVALGIKEMPKGYNLAQALALLEAEARVSGYDPKHLQDVRTEAEKIADAWREVSAHPESVFEVVDDTLAAMEAQMNAADKLGLQLLGGSNTDEGLERELKLHELAKKKWAERLSRVRKLRHRAREPFPGGFGGDYRCYAAVHAIRFMIYVGRSSIGADSSIFRIGKHHVEFSIALWLARNNLQYHDHQWVDVTDPEQTQSPAPYDGVMGVMPPGHGKTALAAHAITLIIDQNPREKWIFGHAQAPKAEENLAYVGSNFDPNTANGRRNISLFGPPVIAKKNSDTLDLEDRSSETRKASTIRAHGITSKISGSDADGIWFDDPCDQELAEQETTRKRVADRMNGTWRTRKRGKKAFEIITTTLWHHDDPNSQWMDLITKGKINYLLVKRECGGPDQKFAPLWPDEYPASRLKQIYAQMRNHRLYAAAYQSNPQPEELRRIKRLAYYLPGSDEHTQFVRDAVFHLSLDPSATNNEKSDKASFVYAGVGDIKSVKDGVHSYERRMRVCDAMQFRANQTEGVDTVCAYAETHSTHYCHVETRSGFNATAEMLEARGIDVIRHDPKNQKKLLRLEHVAVMLDDSNRARGFPGAVVEFPGMLMEDGTIGPDPESDIAWLAKQILDAGVAVEDHGLDATTQLCKYLGPELGVGEGSVTIQAQEANRFHENPAINRMLEECAKERNGRNAGHEDWAFMCGKGSN